MSRLAVGTRVRNTFKWPSEDDPKLGDLGEIEEGQPNGWEYYVTFSDSLRRIPMDPDEFEVVED